RTLRNLVFFESIQIRISNLLSHIDSSTKFPGKLTQNHFAFGDLCAFSSFFQCFFQCGTVCLNISSANNRERSKAGKSLKNHLQIVVRIELAVLNKTVKKERVHEIDDGQLSDLRQGMSGGGGGFLFFTWGINNEKIKQFQFGQV